METISKSSDLLTRLRNVSLENELKLSDLWPRENVMVQSPFNSNLDCNRTTCSSSWNDYRSASPAAYHNEPASEPVVVHQEKPVVEEIPVEKPSVSVSVENRENPFAKISQTVSKPALEFHNLQGWLASLSCFGILGFLCGGSLTAWSVLSGSGSHSLTALGLSLLLSGILMFVLVGLSQTMRLVRGRS